MRPPRILAALCAFTLLALPAAAFADTSFATYLSQLEQQYQLPTGILGKIANAENSGRATGCATTSSACGMFQFIDSTWESASKALMCQSGTTCGPLNPSLRNNPDIAAKVEAYMLAVLRTQLSPVITQAKVNLSAGLYLGHFLGSGGARTLLLAYMQNPSQSSCALLPKQCASNQSIMANRSVSQLISWAAAKMSVPGVPSVPGNFACANGVSYAYSYCDIPANALLPANTVIPPNPYGQYATVFPTAATPPPTPTTPLGTTIPMSQIAPSTGVATPPVSTTGTAGGTTGAAATSGSACTPQYYCSNNTVYYKSDSCSTSVFQSCMYGCQGTICAPAPTGASSTASLYSQSTNSGSVSLGASIVGNPVIVATGASSSPLSPLLSSTINTIIAGANSTANGLLPASTTWPSGASAYEQDTLTENAPYQSYQPADSPLFSVLNQLKSVLGGLLAYLGSL